jgi:hypothetical protein
MSHLLQGMIVLAVDQDAFRVWGRFDHGKASDGAGQLMMIAGIAALLLLIAMVWRLFGTRSTKTYETSSPVRLFRELCAAHRLKRSERRLLRHLSTARALNNPAMLFVEPQHFETKNLPPHLKTSAAELRALRAKLFG